MNLMGDPGRGWGLAPSRGYATDYLYYLSWLSTGYKIDLQLISSEWNVFYFVKIWNIK